MTNSCSECDSGIPHAVLGTEDCGRCEYFRKRVKAKRHVKRRVYENPLFIESLKHAAKPQKITVSGSIPVDYHICVFHKETDGLWHCPCGRKTEYL